MKVCRYFLWFGVLLTQGGCQEVSNGPERASWKEIEAAWSGAAELSRYELKQERYGEVREGVAMLVFVREPFLKERQVKDESGRGDYQALKMNVSRRFLTGAYPYNTMVSVFQPLEKGSSGKALKVTTSVQEWCGHVFVQTNRRGEKSRTEVRSYFEKEEGGVFEQSASVLLEDEIWTALRVDPLGLPVGEVKVMPSSLWLRFSHRDPVAEPARTRWLVGKGGKTVIYEISYLQTGRVMAIEIQKQLPYGIQSWREWDRSGLLSSGALAARESNIDYWNYSDDSKGKKLRSKLGLKN